MDMGDSTAEKKLYDLHKTKCHVRNDKYLNVWSENLW